MLCSLCTASITFCDLKIIDITCCYAKPKQTISDAVWWRHAEIHSIMIGRRPQRAAKVRSSCLSCSLANSIRPTRTCHKLPRDKSHTSRRLFSRSSFGEVRVMEFRHNFETKRRAASLRQLSFLLNTPCMLFVHQEAETLSCHGYVGRSEIEHLDLIWNHFSMNHTHSLTHSLPRLTSWGS